MFNKNNPSILIDSERVGTQTKIDSSTNTYKHITSMKLNNKEIYCGYTGVTVVYDSSENKDPYNIPAHSISISDIYTASAPVTNPEAIIFGADVVEVTGNFSEQLIPRNIVVYSAGNLHTNPFNITNTQNTIFTDNTVLNNASGLDNFIVYGFCGALLGANRTSAQLYHVSGTNGGNTNITLPWKQINMIGPGNLIGTSTYINIPDKEIVIGEENLPTDYDNQSIRIAQDSFRYVSGVEKITIKSSTKSLDNYRTGIIIGSQIIGTFNNMPDLKEVIFDVPTITHTDGGPYGLLRGNPNLEKVVFPPTMDTTGAYTLYDCPKLKTLIMPQCTTIDGYFCWGCYELGEITWPSGVTLLRDRPFYNCPKLKVNIPGRPTLDGSSPFGYNENLTEVDNSSEIVFTDLNTEQYYYYGIADYFKWDYKFNGKLRIYPGIYPSNTWRDSNWDGHTLTGTLHNNNDISSITEEMALTCNGDIDPEPIVDGANVYGIFEGNEYLTEFIFNSAYEARPKSYPINEHTKGVNIRNEIRCLDYSGDKWFSAFKDCVNLTTIRFWMCPSRISASMFEGCTNLNNIAIDSGVGMYIKGRQYRLLTIGEKAFKNCSSLTSTVFQYLINYADNEASNYYYLYISPNAFEGCTSLTTLDIPAWLTQTQSEVQTGGNKSGIGANAFYRCTGLTQVTFHRPQSEIQQCENYPWGIDPSVMVFST